MPFQLTDVVNGTLTFSEKLLHASDGVTDIKALTPNDPSLLEKARPAFQKYNEEQLTCVKLPGGSQDVCTEMKHARRFPGTDNITTQGHH